MNIENGIETRVNREYKSDVFKMYFSIKKNALELYNAMNGTDYTDEEELIVNTLENGIFMKRYNDVSFIISRTVSFYEHQSSINPNMPLRDLYYVTDIYRPYVMKNDIYGPELIMLPTPKFVVFYNGLYNAPDRYVMRLSDAFASKSDDPELELKVQFININLGHNKDLLDKCVALRDYATLTQRVRDNLKNGMEIEEAATEAVESCIKDHIMEDFLMKEKAGVIEMHVLDFDEEKHNESLLREGRKNAIYESVENMLSKGKTPEEIADFCGYPIDLIHEVEQSMRANVSISD